MPLTLLTKKTTKQWNWLIHESKLINTKSQEVGELWTVFYIRPAYAVCWKWKGRITKLTIRSAWVRITKNVKPRYRLLLQFRKALSWLWLLVFFNPAVLINFTFLLNIRENSHFSSLLAFLYFMCLVFNCSQLLFKYTTVHIYSIFYPLFASVLAQP